MTTTPKSNQTAAIEVERMEPGPSWDGNYPDHIQRYEFVTKLMSPGAHVLDAGCGCGYGSAHLADHGAAKVVAVDIAPRAIDLARQHFNRSQIVWLQDDCHSLDQVIPHAPFDVICNLENIEHLNQPERFLGRAARLVKPGGFLITSTPNRILMNNIRGLDPDKGSTNPFHHREFTGQEFDAMLHRHFDEVTFWYQCLTPVSRARQAFEPALYAIWSNPAMRAGRRLQRLMGRKVPTSLRSILPPRDWEIQDRDPGDDVTWTFLALCRKPRVGN